MAKTKIIIAVIIAGTLIALALILSKGNSSPVADGSVAPVKIQEKPESVVPRIEGNTQIIEMTAKGGFTPETIVAKAGVKTILRVITRATYDCSSAVSIPDLNYRKILPASGTTDIEIPAQSAGKEIQGTCGMGMYRFSVRFE